MSGIYKQHEKHFANVSAYVIMKSGKPVAKIAFKFPSDGAGRLYVYVHWIGETMVRGYAGGYGYDKSSAACSSAAAALVLSDDVYSDGTPHYKPSERKAFNAFKRELLKDDGYGWDSNLRKAGFSIVNAV